MRISKHLAPFKYKQNILRKRIFQKSQTVNMNSYMTFQVTGKLLLMVKLFFQLSEQMQSCWTSAVYSRLLLGQITFLKARDYYRFLSMKIWYTELLFHQYLDLCSFCDHLDCACLIRQFLLNYLLDIHVLGFSQILNSIVYLLDVVDVYPRQQMQYTLLSRQHTNFKYLSASPNLVKMVVLALTDSKCSNMKDAFWHWFGFTVRRPKETLFQHYVLGLLI